MSLGNIANGKGTYAVGWSTVGLGVALLLLDAGDLIAAPGASCTSILKPLLTSPGVFTILTGFGVNTGRRAYANATKRAEVKREAILQNQKTVLKGVLKEILSETAKGRKP